MKSMLDKYTFLLKRAYQEKEFYGDVTIRTKHQLDYVVSHMEDEDVGISNIPYRSRIPDMLHNG